MEHVTVTLEGAITLPAMVGATRWNGWECPYFLVADVRAAREQFEEWGAGIFPDSEMTFRWDDAADMPVIIEEFEGEEPWNLVQSATVDGTDYVTIGYASFVWSIAK